MTLCYKRIVDLTQLKNEGRFLLYFGAVDEFTEVFINKQKVGEHDGGYTYFNFDITNYINSDLENIEILVKVQDNYDKNGVAIGKQGDPRRRIFYTKTGGIWLTVWVKSVPETYIKDVKITPKYDFHSVSFNMRVEGNQKIIGNIKIFDKENKLVNFSQAFPNVEANYYITNIFH